MKKDGLSSVKIKNLSPGDRPREKLLSFGVDSLSTAELLSIVIGSGGRSQNVVEVSKGLLKHVDNDLHQLAKLSPKDLQKMKGIGQQRAVTIVAALELGKRRRENHEQNKSMITTSRQAYELVRDELMDLPREEFWLVLLNRGNRLIRKLRVSKGGVSGTVVDPKVIFKIALEELASNFIVAHNHPSQIVLPSKNDLELTKQLKEGGKLLEVQLLDHIIICGEKYFSFADESMI